MKYSSLKIFAVLLIIVNTAQAGLPTIVPPQVFPPAIAAPISRFLPSFLRPSPPQVNQSYPLSAIDPASILSALARQTVFAQPIQLMSWHPLPASPFTQPTFSPLETYRFTLQGEEADIFDELLPEVLTSMRELFELATIEGVNLRNFEFHVVKQFQQAFTSCKAAFQQGQLEASD